MEYEEAKLLKVGDKIRHVPTDEVLEILDIAYPPWIENQIVLVRVTSQSKFGERYSLGPTTAVWLTHNEIEHVLVA